MRGLGLNIHWGVGWGLTKSEGDTAEEDAYDVNDFHKLLIVNQSILAR